MRGWDFTVSGIKKRPGVIGTWTNKLVYAELPEGVLDEIKRLTPKSESGRYSARLFQSLSDDIGNPHLKNQLTSIIALMQSADNWDEFIVRFNKVRDRRNEQDLKTDQLILDLTVEDFPEDDVPV